MSLEVVASFNDVEPGSSAWYKRRVLDGRPHGFVEQLEVLGGSVVRHLPGTRMRAVHTQALDPAQRARLEGRGWVVEQRERADGPDFAARLHDRLAAYEGIGAGHALLVDADTVFVAPPRLPLDRPVRVMYAGGAVFDRDGWQALYDAVGLDLPAGELDARAFRRWFWWRRRGFLPFFNNGAVLVARDEAQALAARVRAARDALVAAGLVARLPRLDHFFDQVCLSLAVVATDGWDLLPPGVNTLGTRVDLRNPLVRRRTTHLHYLANTDVHQLLKRYGSYFDVA